FYDYHVPHALDMPPLRTGYIETPSPFTPLGTKGMGEGGGAGIHAVCAAVQDALRGHGDAIVCDSHNPYRRVWELLQHPELEHAAMKIKGTGVGAILSMQTQFDLADADEGGTAMKWAADVRIAGPVGAMGQRVLQPIVNQQVQHVLGALDKQVQEALAGAA